MALDLALFADPPAARPGDVPFVEAIDHLRGRLGRLLPSRAWTDTYGRVHAVGFAVAGATRDALLTDLGAAVVRGIEGGTLDQFRQDFDGIVAKHGWAYRGERGWRTRTIFETNLRSSYAAGKWAQMQRLKATRPYARYVAVLDGRTRPEHRAWHGTILPVDDPWWETHWPPCGWGCRCTVMSLSERDLVRNGWSVSEPPADRLVERRIRTPEGDVTKLIPQGIDPGFEHNPGLVLERPFVPQLEEDERGGFVAPIARALVAPPRTPLPPLPPPKPAPASRLLPEDIGDQAAAERFLTEFGASAERPAIVQTVDGAGLAVGREMFQASGGDWKVGKRDRKPYLLLLSDALRDPAEVWASLEMDRAGRLSVRRRYIGTYEILESGRRISGLASFEWTGASWRGVTAFPAKPDRAPHVGETYLDNRARFGVLLYRRGGADAEG